MKQSSSIIVSAIFLLPSCDRPSDREASAKSSSLWRRPVVTKVVDGGVVSSKSCLMLLEVVSTLEPGKRNLGGGNSNIFIFTPILGEMIQSDGCIFFQMGW